MNLNQFQKIKILGQGTYGKCYLVMNKQKQQLCVLKQIDINGMNDQQIQQSMKQARILQALDHPSIIRFISSFKSNEYLNIIMSYADGGDLNKKIKNNHHELFSQEQILNWFTQLCLAIKHVHDRKIIHRDLKSQNIFLTEDGTVKLGDFGIAKPLQLTLEKIHTVVGTPYYMSPEICQNKQYSFKTDIWSLGIILFEMCQLKPPFDANSLPILALKISKGDLPIMIGNWSKQIKQLISQLLQVDPNKRPTINQILKNGIIKNRIDYFLSKNIRQRQFSSINLSNKQNINKQGIKIINRNKIVDNGKVNAIVSPRSQNSSNYGGLINISAGQTPQNKQQQQQQQQQSNLVHKFKDNNSSKKAIIVVDKKIKKNDCQKRQSSQPLFNIIKNQNTKIETNVIMIDKQQQKIIKSIASMSNLQCKKSLKKQNPFKKKNKNNQQITQQLEEIKQVRDQVLGLHDQLNQRQISLKKQTINSINNDVNIQEIQKKNQKNLKDTLEQILIQKLNENQLSINYQLIQQNQGFILNNKVQEQIKQIQLLSLYYGLIHLEQ